MARAAAGVAGAGAACVAYGTLIERRWYRRRTIPVPGVLHGAPGQHLRILHLSDIHLDPPQAHRTRFLRSLEGAGHDLVVVTGDLLGSRDAEDAAVAALAGLVGAQVPGVVVLGSNDIYAPVPKNPLAYFLDPDRRHHGDRLDTPRLVSGLRAAGYTVLRNQTATLRTRAGDVAVAGVDDPHLHDAVLPDLAAITHPPGLRPVLRLGVVHAPYTAALDLLVDAGNDLLTAGHTHGGQVRFPPFGAVVANCDLPLDQIRGLSRYGGAWLHVSPGLGHSRYAPFRFACRPEATLLDCSP